MHTRTQHTCTHMYTHARDRTKPSRSFENAGAADDGVRFQQSQVQVQELRHRFERTRARVGIQMNSWRSFLRACARRAFTHTHARTHVYSESRAPPVGLFRSSAMNRGGVAYICIRARVCRGIETIVGGGDGNDSSLTHGHRTHCVLECIASRKCWVMRVPSN